MMLVWVGSSFSVRSVKGRCSYRYRYTRNWFKDYPDLGSKQYDRDVLWKSGLEEKNYIEPLPL